ncbi:adhesion G protein-coupled receptor F4 [Xenopus laevis]|uniref:Adhesion G protein-coupled receptor F4 n=1 Tax=Xenopus laevis TaxID=8355 RepID=A0A8J1KQB2_XENLA|nr:adhesion G protein-coupled receptor F4 [Xenopus laevis]
MEFVKVIAIILLMYTKRTGSEMRNSIGKPVDVECLDDFGECVEGNLSCKKCKGNFEGNITARCQRDEWKLVLENCVSPNMRSLLLDFETETTLLGDSWVTKPESFNPEVDHGQDQCLMVPRISSEIQKERTTAGNIVLIVTLLQKISLRCFIRLRSEENVQDYSKMANHILNTSTISNWSLVLQKNASSVLLTSLHDLALSMASSNDTLPRMSIQKDFLYLQSKNFSEDNDFTFHFNSTQQPANGQIFIEKEKVRDLSELFAVSLAYPTLGNILPTESDNVSVNGLVMSLALSSNVNEILLKFEKVNKSLSINNHCAAWDRAKKTWIQDSCQMQEDSVKHTVCKCNYSENYLSFSILMSHKASVDPALHYITLIGLGISICSLVLCLIIEASVWRHITSHRTAYMRHVSIANIAVSLLLADVWFIVGAATYKTKSSGVCITSTFFTHFFYLSLFFWMLIMGLSILYRIFLVYHDMSATRMLVILFSVGYGCPFLISILTLVITLSQPGKPYTREDSCWLNWEPSKALLAFVIPAFLILAVNAVVTCTVISVLLRPSIGQTPRANERGYLVQIGRCVAILTPLLGLTWGIGIATIIEDSSIVFDYLFTILNALQGFLILLLGTLMDPQVRKALKTQITSLSWKTSETKNTSSNPKSGSQPPDVNKTLDEELS